MSKSEPLPLKEFHFPVVQQPLFGLLRNVHEDLRRLIEVEAKANNLDAVRNLTLLLVMIRFASNSYDAICFLLSDVDDNPKRHPRFVLVVSPINRQIMDLWFSLVYMLDDFEARALAYEQCGWRELGETVAKMRARHGDSSDWRPWYEDMESLLTMMEAQIPVTAAQKANPRLIPYWFAPYKLTQQPSASRSFLVFLEQLLYGDTSAEAHLKPGGLIAVSGVVLSSIAPPQVREQIENRNIHQYKFIHFSRTVLTLLAIATEIDNYCKLNNRDQLSKLWGLLAGYSSDAQDVYEGRYRAMLT
jgi:hypothetical protein